MSEQIRVRAHWRAFGSIFILALSLRLLYVLANYTPGLGAFEWGDYPSYAIPARHFMQAGDFQNSLFLVRPPGFPLLIALLGDQTLTVLLVNCALGALTAALTALLYLAAIGKPGGALLAGALVALDPASVVYSAFLGAEPLANLSLTAAILCFWLALKRADRLRASALWLSLAGLALSLSMLTRPAAYLLWLPLSALFGVYTWRAKRAWLGLALFVLISGGTFWAWNAHNEQVFGHRTFSTVGPYTMLYHRAASIEHLATGVAPDEVFIRLNERVEARLGRTLPEGIDIESARHTYLAASPEVEAALTAVSLEVFLRYPHVYLATIPLGLARMFGYTYPLKGLWRAPDVLWNIGLVVLTALGLWQLWRQRQRLFVSLTLLIGMYFTVGVLLVKTSGSDTRERSMLTMLMACCAAYALSTWWTRRQRSQSG